jgi:hypothetical protein
VVVEAGADTSSSTLPAPRILPQNRWLVELVDPATLPLVAVSIKEEGEEHLEVLEVIQEVIH